MTDRKIEVYVRREGQDARLLSFKPSPEISQKEALGKGFAIDGNSYTLGITCDGVVGTEVIAGSPFGSVSGIPRLLSVVLADTQREIVKWLGSYDYEVIFK